MTYVLCTIGIIYLLSFWFDFINSLIGDVSFCRRGMFRIKNTLEPFRKFVVLVYKKLRKKEKRILG